MSGDRKVLTALALLLPGTEMRYFELVQMAFGDKKRNCYMCIAKRSIVFMRQDFNNKLNDGGGERDESRGELKYSAITKVVVDKTNRSRFWLKLSESTWGNSNQILILAESRDLLLKHLQVSWQTDCMLQSRKVATFPLAWYKLDDKATKSDPDVKPFKEFGWAEFKGYKFMLPTTYTPRPNAIQANETGEWEEKESGTTLEFRVHDIMTLEDLVMVEREHIRWVAREYKAHLVKEESQFYVFRNNQRSKTMNLVGDPAAWYGWELLIRTRTHVIICMVFRRQYIPPMCDTGQDIAIVMKCPAETFAKNEVGTVLKAGVMADSISPLSVPANYPELVQAKLDALRLDEDGLEWVGNHTKLVSKWREEAKRFLMTILHIVMTSGDTHKLEKDLMTEKRYLVRSIPREEWAEIKPIEGNDFIVFVNKLREDGDGLLAGTFPDPEIDKQKRLERAQNMWMARLARYFAWAVDGGLLGPRFTMDKLISDVLPYLEGDAETKVMQALMFMLHMRDCDTRERWDPAGDLLTKLSGSGAERYQFNDRVMQQLISNDYIKKKCRKTGPNAGDPMKTYYQCLANLLRSKTGVNLRAYICRIFMESNIKNPGATKDSRSEDDSKVIVIPALLDLCRSGHTYLATYASAALVNLSQNNELVKMHLMSHGMAKAAVKNMQCKDDDLIMYTASLMVNLTKEAHHRAILANQGMLPVLYDMLTSSYHQCKGTGGQQDGLSSAVLANNMKEKILERICSIIGHFCKDEEHRDHLIDKFQHTVKCFIYICTHCTPCSLLMSRSMYVLKQLCAARNDEKRIIGAYVIKHLCSVLRDRDFPKQANLELLIYAMQLLKMLASYKDNCTILFEAQIDEVLKNMRKAPASKNMQDFDTMSNELNEKVKEVERSQFEE